MIRTWYWASRTYTPNVEPPRPMMVEAIKEFPDDFHFFIIINVHLANFENWVVKNNFHVYYRGGPAYNWRYPGYEKKLNVFILTVNPTKKG